MWLASCIEDWEFGPTWFSCFAVGGPEGGPKCKIWIVTHYRILNWAPPGVLFVGLDPWNWEFDEIFSNIHRSFEADVSANTVYDDVITLFAGW